MRFIRIFTIYLFLVDYSKASTNRLNSSGKGRNSNTDFMTLRAELFTDFSPDLRPVLNRSEPLIVNVSLFVFNIHSLDERKQQLTMSAWFYLEWMDAYLNWNESEHNGLSHIMLPKTNVWTPDLKIFNGYEGLVELSDYGNLVRLSSDGKITFEPGSAFEVYCLVDITYYPFDRQECSIVLMFWMSRVSEADMLVSNQDYVFRALRANGEWDVEFIGANHYHKGFSDEADRKYAYLEYTFRLTRKRTFYVLHFLVPVTLLSLLNAVVFILPPESGEKMSLSITVLLSFTIFISLLNSSLPQTSLHVSLFAVYLSVLLGIGTLSVILSAVQLFLHYRFYGTEKETEFSRRASSIRNKSFNRRSARDSTITDSKNENDCNQVDYCGLLLSQEERQRIQAKQQSYRVRYQSDSNNDTKDNSGPNEMTPDGDSNPNNRPYIKPKDKYTWCIDPRIFDRVGFLLSLLMTIGSTFTIIVVLSSH